MPWKSILLGSSLEWFSGYFSTSWAATFMGSSNMILFSMWALMANTNSPVFARSLQESCPDQPWTNTSNKNCQTLLIFGFRFSQRRVKTSFSCIKTSPYSAYYQTTWLVKILMTGGYLIKSQEDDFRNQQAKKSLKNSRIFGSYEAWESGIRYLQHDWSQRLSQRSHLSSTSVRRTPLESSRGLITDVRLEKG